VASRGDAERLPARRRCWTVSTSGDASGGGSDIEDAGPQIGPQHDGPIAGAAVVPMGYRIGQVAHVHVQGGGSRLTPTKGHANTHHQQPNLDPTAPCAITREVQGNQINQALIAPAPSSRSPRAVPAGRRRGSRRRARGDGHDRSRLLRLDESEHYRHHLQAAGVEFGQFGRPARCSGESALPCRTRVTRFALGSPANWNSR
jgi:hypothetical protein